MRKFIEEAYRKSIYIHNNGSGLEFYSTFKRKPVFIMFAFDEDNYLWAKKNNKKYMLDNEHTELFEWIERDNKLWGYRDFPSEWKQIEIEQLNNQQKNQMGVEIMSKMNYEDVLKKRIKNLNELADKYEELGTSYSLRRERILEEVEVLDEVLRGISDIGQWLECYREDSKESGSR